jgi:amino acid transporter
MTVEPATEDRQPSVAAPAVGGPGASADPTIATGAQNAVLLGLAVLLLTTAINVVGVRVTAVFNSIGVTIEILGVIALVVVLLILSERAPGGRADDHRRG